MVAVDGKSLLGVSLNEAVGVITSVGDVFELLVRKGVPTYIQPPELELANTSLNDVPGDVSVWSAVENELDGDGGTQTSANKTRNGFAGPRARSGCRIVRIIRDDGGLGFSILGGIDSDMHGIFVTQVAPNSPASGKLAPGDIS